ncbi:MAG: hypothetical protein ISN29_06025 [Gammaproteobacteria bacterium AqS3]|nr:hypothetical protein [Gammaproteobacteria bacterium AqS3]
MQQPAPKWISQLELFADAAAQVPAEGLVPYQINTPLFSDYAEKYRFVGIPPHSRARYRDPEVPDFPVGTVLVKTFAYPSLSESGLNLLETRLLVHRQGGWDALAYVWNEDQTDARLKVAGARLAVAFNDPAGRHRQISYLVPNKNQCAGCHAVNRQVLPIGPTIRQLNGPQHYADAGVQNQVEYWTRHGLLSGAPKPTRQKPWPVSVRWNDEQASLDARARSYLEINCAHCHRPEGAASHTNLYLRASDVGLNIGLNKKPVAAGRGSGALTRVLVPGAPDESILLFRMDNNTDPDIMMPELGRVLNHDEGIDLIRRWISSLDER